MSNEITIRIKKGQAYSIEKVECAQDGADAHIVVTDDKKLRISVKRASDTNRLSSRVVDVTMCG